MGVLYGYRNTLRYIAGIVTGVCLYMLLAGGVSASLLTLIPSIEKPLRFVGAAYILWLAFKTVQASYQFEKQTSRPMGFVNGLLLQLVNFKSIVFGLTLFSTFLAPIARTPTYLLLAAASLAGITFVATSTWALGGTAINTHLHQPAVRSAINLLLALLLVYTAANIAGFI
jgi:cysteine/O-acetylserine efflux protein